MMLWALNDNLSKDFVIDFYYEGSWCQRDDKRPPSAIRFNQCNAC